MTVKNEIREVLKVIGIIMSILATGFLVVIIFFLALVMDAKEILKQHEDEFLLLRGREQYAETI